MTIRPATLVLSGGGAKGAFQIGAERVLREERGYRWERIFGVSVGALNATMLGQQRHAELAEVWQSIEEKDVYQKYSWPQVAFRVAILKKLSLYDDAPLRRTIDRHAAGHRFRIPVHVGRVSLVSGQYELVTSDRPEHEFLDAVWHSATMPIIWEPIGPEAYVDGGLRNITPLGDALQFNPTEVVVIIASPNDIDRIERPRSIVDVATRSLTDITLNEILINDVREFVRINYLVKQAADRGVELRSESGAPYRYVPITVVRPRQSLGDTLDFDREAIRRRMALGEIAAREATTVPAAAPVAKGAGRA
ncbi:MAG TPA: patatin-like phospholipase family protein [Myxococcaceae bacterium]|nr:patatin-like phospholipase family protein [Myxococcaceae bacterium]